MRAFFLSAFSILILASCSDNEKEQKELNNKTSTSQGKLPSIEMLESSPFIELMIGEVGSREYRTLLVTDAHELSLVKSWVMKYAWPPIDQNSLGEVLPRGHFNVFNTLEPDNEFFQIPVYGVTSRANEEDIHVTNENWDKLITQLKK